MDWIGVRWDDVRDGLPRGERCEDGGRERRRTRTGEGGRVGTRSPGLSSEGGWQERAKRRQAGVERKRSAGRQPS